MLGCQKELGLDIGCHICEKLGREITPTYKFLNPHCAECEGLYCQEHTGSQIEYCIDCRPVPIPISR